MISIFCDLCGRELDGEQIIARNKPWVVSVGNGRLSIAVQCVFEGHHVCRPCAAELLKAALEKEKGAAEESTKIARKEFPMGYIGPIPKDGPPPLTQPPLRSEYEPSLRPAQSDRPAGDDTASPPREVYPTYNGFAMQYVGPIPTDGPEPPARKPGELPAELNERYQKEKAEIESLSKARKEFGAVVKRLRVTKRVMTLGRFCIDYNHDPEYWSDIERGLRLPPDNKAILKKWAQDLGLTRNTAEWEAFMNAAKRAREDWEVDAR